MPLERRLRALILAVLSLTCAALSGTSLSTAAGGLVWFSDHDTLKALDVDANRVALSINVAREPDGLAVDPSDYSVWVLLHKRLVKFGVSGSELLRVELQEALSTYEHPRLVALNPYNGSVWVAAGLDLVQVPRAGEATVRWGAPKKISAIALDVDESVWVAAHDQLFHLSPSGAVLGSVDLKDHFQGVRHLAIDSLGGVIWISDKRRLAKLNFLQITEPPQIIDVPALARDSERYDNEAHSTALDVHPGLGTLWLATENTLLLIDRGGNLLKTIELPGTIGKVDSMAFDSRSLSLWIAGRQGVGRLTGSGDIAAVIPAEKEAEHVTTGRFTLYPTLSILEPSDGTLTNNPRPRVRLSLGSQCSGTPCLLPDAYVGSLHLNVMLNGVAIGPFFTINGTEALYLPPGRLAEGPNTLSGHATDLFGHKSEEATSRFVIDTIPPKFVSIDPADGSTVNNGSVVITGKVDDATANVILADGNGNGISMSTANFSFSVLLNPGLNIFRLTARDPAGNEATTLLRLTHGSLSVKITSPLLGATLTRRGTVVTGDFQGPVNTGITVNGVIAQVLGNRFYANVALQSGANTLTAVATTPDGASMTDSVSVTVNTQSADPFDLAVSPDSGVAPLAVTFSARSNMARPITQLRLEVGDGKTVLTVPSETVVFTYETPGVYQATIRATDASGVTDSHTVAVVVSDGQQMDQLFTALWGGMNQALVQGNFVGAASFLNESAKRKYQPVFEALKPHFAEIIPSYSPLRRVSVMADIGEYAVVRRFNDQNRLYLIYFLKDADGVWRVDGM